MIAISGAARRTPRSSVSMLRWRTRSVSLPLSDSCLQRAQPLGLLETAKLKAKSP